MATDTIRRHHLAMPGRLTRSARNLTVHLPLRWPWADAFNACLTNLRAVVLLTCTPPSRRRHPTPRPRRRPQHHTETGLDPPEILYAPLSPSTPLEV